MICNKMHWIPKIYVYPILLSRTVSISLVEEVGEQSIQTNSKKMLTHD